MSKVYVVDNGDMCIFGVFTTKEKAQYVCDKMNLDYPDNNGFRFYIEERELDVVKSWMVNKELDKLGVKVVPDDSY